MPRLQWGTPGTHFYETGVDRGVLYVGEQAGVAWTGLTSVEVSTSGGGVKSYYLDGVKYLQVSSPEEFSATINAFTYPELFEVCDGTTQVRPGLFLKQQRKQPFGLSYRTLIGNEFNSDHGYKLNIIYNALAEPSQRSYSSIGDTADPSEFSWSVTTRPPAMTGYKRTAHIVIDSRTTSPSVLKAVEDFLYGDDLNPPRLPSLDELVNLYDTEDFSLIVVDNGDGTFSITGPDSLIQELSITTYQITGDTVVAIDEETYTISS